MTAERTSRARLLIVALLLCALTATQVAQFAPGGHHDHHPSHCCGVCSAGQLAALLPAGEAWLANLAAVAWQFAPEQPGEPRDTAVVPWQSRAPPA